MATRKKTLPKGGRSGTKSPRQLMLKDLKGSGLTTDDAKKLGFEVLSRDETKELTNFDCESYLIPYYTINGKLTDG